MGGGGWEGWEGAGRLLEANMLSLLEGDGQSGQHSGLF